MERILHFVTVPHPADAQLELIEIAKTLHPEWQVHVWQDPLDTTGFLLAHYHKEASNGAQLADLIRLDLIYRYGGIYLDSDVRMIRSLDSLCGNENFFCSQDGYYLTNAVFGASKHSPAVRALIDDLLDQEPDWSQPASVTTGPLFFRRVLQWRADITLLPRETFYPYNFDETPRPPQVTTLGIHEWAGSWIPVSLKAQFVEVPPKGFRALKRKLKSLAKRIVATTVLRVAEQYERLHRPAARAYPFGKDLISQTGRGIFMSLPGEDLSITPEIALKGTYEEPELRFLERILRGGDFFVDVGCNVGTFTLVAARQVNTFGRVFGFDPNDEVIKHLRRSLVMNWVHDRVKLFACAVGEKEETVTLRYSKLRLGDGNLGLDEGSTFERSVAELGNVVEKRTNVVKLDDVFPHALEIKILKIDAEGFEHAVLAGARRLFQQKSINYVMIEVLEEVASRRHRLNVRAIGEVVSCGYRICKLDQNGNLLRFGSLREALSGSSSRNLVLERE
jgi:FkbM family methyltransferase